MKNMWNSDNKSYFLINFKSYVNSIFMFETISEKSDTLKLKIV